MKTLLKVQIPALVCKQPPEPAVRMEPSAVAQAVIGLGVGVGLGAGVGVGDGLGLGVGVNAGGVVGFQSYPETQTNQVPCALS